MRVTIKSIARDLGISHMTVSRALSGSEHINVETRKKILEHAERMGYVRSSAASAMRGDPTAIVGLLLPNIVNDFYARFANSLGLLCAESGYDLVIHLTGDDWQQEMHCLTRLQALQARVVLRVPAPRVTGQLAGPVKGPGVINLIRTVDNEASEGELMIDDASAIRQAVEHLAGIGRTRIAYIGGSEALSSGRQRLQAFRDGLAGCELPSREEVIVTGPPGQAMGHERMHAMLASNQPPDAIVCGGFEISNGALNACLERGVRLPEQLAFVGYGDPSFYQWIAGGISTISLSANEVACRAIEMIGYQGSNAAERSKSVSADFIGRQSA